MKIKGIYKIPVFAIEARNENKHPWADEYRAKKPNGMYILASTSLNCLKRELQQQGWIGAQITDGSGRKVK